MNYKGIFGFYDPIKRTGEIYDGRNRLPSLETGGYTVPPPLKLSDITHEEFETRLQSAIDKAERGESKV